MLKLGGKNERHVFVSLTHSTRTLTLFSLTSHRLVFCFPFGYCLVTGQTVFNFFFHCIGVGRNDMLCVRFLRPRYFLYEPVVIHPTSHACPYLGHVCAVTNSLVFSRRNQQQRQPRFPPAPPKRGASSLTSPTTAAPPSFASFGAAARNAQPQYYRYYTA